MGKRFDFENRRNPIGGNPRFVVSMYIMREFEQGSVGIGMCMAVICVLLTTTALLVLNRAGKGRAC